MRHYPQLSNLLRKIREALDLLSRVPEASKRDMLLFANFWEPSRSADRKTWNPAHLIGGWVRWWLFSSLRGCFWWLGEDCWTCALLEGGRLTSFAAAPFRWLETTIYVHSGCPGSQEFTSSQWCQWQYQVLVLEESFHQLLTLSAAIVVASP